MPYERQMQNEAPVVCGLATDKFVENKYNLCTILWNNHYYLM